MGIGCVEPDQRWIALCVVGETHGRSISAARWRRIPLTDSVARPKSRSNESTFPWVTSTRCAALAPSRSAPGGSELDCAVEGHAVTESDVTQLLAAWSDGDPAALERLLPLVYADLRRIAARQLKSERAGHTLSATAVVHEAYLRLAGHSRLRVGDRAHFFAVAAGQMRRILVDHARRRAALKRGGLEVRVTLDEEIVAGAVRDLELLSLDRALDELAALDPRLARIVELRFFAGLTLDDTAVAMDLSRRTVAREWALAKGWLHKRLEALRDGALPGPPAGEVG
jgi:RNA polymerase sigma factor (TIGR02999 family)